MKAAPLPCFRAVLLCLSAFLSLTGVQAQSVLRFHAESGPASLPTFGGLRTAWVRVEALLDRGLPASGLETNVVLRAEVFEAPGPVLSEVALDGTAIELVNPGLEPVDLSGWVLRAASGPRETAGAVDQILPRPTILPPGGTLVWTSETNPASGTVVVTRVRPFPRPWPLEVELRDASGVLVDQVLLRVPEGTRERLWNGVPVSVSGGAGESLLRSGAANHFSAANWGVGPRSVGTMNAGLVLPWRGPSVSVALEPIDVVLTNGVWEGLVQFDGRNAAGWRPGVSVPGGVVFHGGERPLPPAPRLELEWTEGSGVASETSPGRTGRLRVRTPEAVATELAVILRMDAEGEFDVPAEVRIPAGATSATFDVSNRDDAVADGHARVRLKALAAGYREASVMLLNEDNEAGAPVRLLLPGAKPEGAGLLVQSGIVAMAEAAPHDVEVRLESGGRLRVPSRVILPKGSVTVAFPIIIDEDEQVNVAPLEDTIRASVGPGPGGSAALTVMDNDSPAFRLSLPDTIAEGRSVEALLTFDRPADKPRILRTTAVTLLIRVPEELVVPAGAVEFRFRVDAPEDTLVAPRIQPVLGIAWAASVSTFKTLVYRDNELPAIEVRVKVPSLAYDGLAMPVRLEVPDSSGELKLGVGLCRVRVFRPTEQVRMRNDVVEIPIVDGVGEGSVILDGENPLVYLEATFEAVSDLSPGFALVRGRALAGDTLDVASWPGRTTLLALQAGASPGPSFHRLVELHPATGGVVRSLDLPTPAHRIAVSSSGGTAWLASTSNTVQRVDLTTWAHSGEVALGTAEVARDGLLLDVANAAEDEVVVLAWQGQGTSGASFELVGIRGTQRLPVTHRLGLPSPALGLIALPGAGQFAAVLSNEVHRVRLEVDGVRAIRSRPVPRTPSVSLRQPAWLNGALVLGGGHVVDADTLQDLTDYPVATSFPSSVAVLPMPDLGRILFADAQGRIHVIDSGSRARLGQLPFQDLSSRDRPVVDRMVRWGVRGAALLSWTGKKLFLLDDALDFQARADLGVSLALPPRVPGSVGSVLASVTITNRGPDWAESVMLELAGVSAPVRVELAPGGMAEVSRVVTPTNNGFVRLGARVSSATADPNPADNMATAVTFLEPVQGPGEVITELAARHLIASPDGAELWVANGPEAGVEGVVRIDPVTGAELGNIPVGPDPWLLSADAVGSGLYALLGTNRVVRWRFAANAVDVDRTFPGEGIRSMVALPGSGGRLAVLLRSRIVLLAGSNVMQELSIPVTERGWLAAAGSQLWLARAGELRLYNPAPEGLAFLRSAAVVLPQGNPRFNTDGRWAAFSGMIFDSASGLRPTTASDAAPIVLGPDDTCFSVLGGRLRKHALFDLAEAGTRMIEANHGGAPIQDLVRWGTNGFAFRTSGGLVVSIPSAFGPEPPADLAVSIEAVGVPYFRHPSGFRIVVTNRGPSAVSRAWVEVTETGASSITAPPPAMNEADKVVLVVGPLAAGESREFRVTATPDQAPLSVSRVQLTARVLFEGVDATPGDAPVTASWNVLPAPMNLGVRLEVPGSLQVGREFEVLCFLTNAGPSSMGNPGLGLLLPEHFHFVGADAGTVTPPFNGRITVSRVARQLDPGTELRVRLRFRATRPGVAAVAAYPIGVFTDPIPGNDVGRAALYVPPADGDTREPRFAVGFGAGQWSLARRQWIVSDAHGLTLLDAVTLAPQGSITFPSGTTRHLLNPEGTHVWVESSDGEVQRWNLATGELERRIPVPRAVGLVPRTFAAVPGSPDLLIAIAVDAAEVPVVTVFSGSSALPRTYSEDFFWFGFPVQAYVSSNRRVFVSSGFLLRELELTADGVRLVRNLDAFGSLESRPLFESDDVLGFNATYVLDLATMTTPLTGDLLRPVNDHLGFRFMDVGGGLQRFDVYNTLKRAWVYRGGLMLPRSYIAGGGQGLLVLGADGGRLSLPAEGPADLILRTNGVPVVRGAHREFEVPLVLRQAEGWLAKSVRIHADLPPGVELVSPVPTHARNGFDVVPGLDPTLIVLRLRASAPGPLRIGIEATTEAGDPTPGDARVWVDLVVPPEPVLLLADQAVAEDTRVLEFQLSEEAPQPMTFVLEAEHLTTGSADLMTSRVDVTFPTGSRRAAVPWIVADNRVEADERFRVRLVSGPVSASAPSGMITIRNDDVAVWRAAGETRTEGATGIGPATLLAWVESPIDVPVDVGFSTVDGTAVAGLDYLPVSGRLMFTPSNTTNRVGIPILGDTRHEPTEDFGIRWEGFNGVAWSDGSPTFTLVNDDPIPRAELGIRVGAGDALLLRFESVIGVRYALEAQSGLVPEAWQVKGTAVSGTGGMLEFRVSIDPETMRFFRLREVE